MKILHANTVRTEKNGITNVMFNLLREREEDVIQDVVSINTPDSAYEEELSAVGGRFFVLSRSAKHPLKYVLALKKVIKDEKYDIVHIHGNSHTTVLELLAAKLAGCKVRIVHAHSTSCAHPIAHKLLTPIFTALCTHGFACGDAAGRFMFGKRPFTVINNAVNVNKYRFDSALRSEYREELGATPDTVVIGHVGVINENKNQILLVRAFAKYHSVNENSRLVLIGDGPERGNVEREISLLGLTDKVILTGARSDVYGLLNALDTFTLPSHYEGLPLTVIEAQTSGLPCLISANVTTEVDKTGNVAFLSIDNPALWSDSFANIRPMSDAERERASASAIDSIRAAGYDISVEAKLLKEKYRSYINH